MLKIRIPLIACVAIAAVTSIEFAAAADSFDLDHATSFNVERSVGSSWEPYKSDYAYDALSAGSERPLAGQTWERLGKAGVRLLPFAVLLLLSWWTNRRSKKPARRFTD